MSNVTYTCTLWLGNTYSFLIHIFHGSVTVVRQSFHGILVLYIMHDISKVYCFISLTTYWDSIWTFDFWCINHARQQQGLLSDLDFLWIRDIGLLIISGHASPLHHVRFFQTWLIYPITYCHEFNLNICFLTYKFDWSISFTTYTKINLNI